MAISEGIQDRSTITKELAEVERELRSCNDPARLAELAIWCRTRRVDFSSKLRQRVAKLEGRKSQLLAKLHEISQQLNQEDSVEEWEMWLEFGVKTFLEAYRHPQLRNRVHRWISVRRHPRDYP